MDNYGESEIGKWEMYSEDGKQKEIQIYKDGKQIE